MTIHNHFSIWLAEIIQPRTTNPNKLMYALVNWKHIYWFKTAQIPYPESKLNWTIGNSTGWSLGRSVAYLIYRPDGKFVGNLFRSLDTQIRTVSSSYPSAVWAERRQMLVSLVWSKGFRSLMPRNCNMEANVLGQFVRPNPSTKFISPGFTLHVNLLQRTEYCCISALHMYIDR